MAKVEVYTSMLCGYCHAAKRLLKQKEVDYVEYDVGCDVEKRAKAVGRPKWGRRAACRGHASPSVNTGRCRHIKV